jgi:cell wall-associated NlpC family hydrolase
VLWCRLPYGPEEGLRVELLREVALSFLGVHYQWGGKNPLIGLDCSGLTQCILSSVGLGPSGVMTADSQYRYWLVHGVKAPPSLGALTFYGDDKHIHHIGFCLDSVRMVEAAHGGKDVSSRAVAALKGAYVKVSPITRPGKPLAVLMPDYASVGLKPVGLQDSDSLV